MQVHGDSHLAVVSTLTDLVHIYSEKREFKSSIDYLSKSLAITLKVHKDNHPNLANAYHNLGMVLVNQMYPDCGRALENMTECLRIRKNILGPDDPVTENTDHIIEDIQEMLEDDACLG